jgi:citrate synthase
VCTALQASYTLHRCDYLYSNLMRTHSCRTLSQAAEMFTKGSDSAVGAAAFVKQMRQENQLIMGIGHRIKSLSNPDMRVSIIKEYAKAHFRDTAVLDFALSVEQVVCTYFRHNRRIPLSHNARFC